jgi:uncharacterized protein
MVPGGAWFLHAAEKFLRFVLGTLIFLFGLFSFMNRIQFRINNDRWGMLFGFIAGITGGAFNAAAPRDYV